MAGNLRNKNQIRSGKLLYPLLILFLFIIFPSCYPPDHIYSDSVFELSFDPNNSETEVVRLIENAETSIYIALYGFDNEPVQKALIEAKYRGIDIKCITEYDSETEASWQALIREGIDVTLGNLGGIMHDKYFIIDGKYLITGSTNLTAGMFLHFNNMIILKSASLCADFKKDFDVMYNGYFSGGGSMDKDAGYNAVHGGTWIWTDTIHTVGDYTIQAFFTPYEDSYPSETYNFYNYDDAANDSETYTDARNVIIELIQNANTKIQFLTFAFTDRVIIDELMKAYEVRNVDVRIWMDYSQFSSNFSHHGDTYMQMRSVFGERVKLCRRVVPGRALLHHKVMMVDEETLILGSLNYSSAGVLKNDENFLKITNAGPLIKFFQQEVARVDAESNPMPYRE